MAKWLSIELVDASVCSPIDLTTTDGMTDYGRPVVVARALTVMEYQRYRRYIPLAPKAWWTATGYSTLSSQHSYSYYAWCVRPDGTLDYYNAYSYCYAARPALYLKSSTEVSVECEGNGKKLEDYTDRELLAELARRDDARHTVTARG